MDENTGCTVADAASDTFTTKVSRSISMEEFSSCQHYQNQVCLDDEVAGPAATLIPHPQQGMVFDPYDSTCSSNNHTGAQLLQDVQGSSQLLSYDSSPRDTSFNEIQDLVNYGDFHQPVQHQLDQPFQQTELKIGIQPYNSSSFPDTTQPYPTTDLFNLLQQIQAYPFQTRVRKTPEVTKTHWDFLGEFQSNGIDKTNRSAVMYDPLLHLNLPSEPPIFRELFQSLPNCRYSLPTSRNSSIFEGASTPEMDGNGGMFKDADGRQFENTVLQFTSGDVPCVGKGCKDGDDTKHFATEKQRRQHLNDKYQTLRSLVPSPTKNDRASIVGDAIGYIKELLRTLNELQLLVENKRYRRDSSKGRKTEEDTLGGEEMECSNMKPMGDSDQCYNGYLRSSWLQRKSKDTEVDVRIIDDEVTIKLVQRKKINCLLFVSKILDELLLDLQHVAGGHIGDYCSFLFNTKINEGSSVYASAIASKMIEVMDRQYAAAISPGSNY